MNKYRNKKVTYMGEVFDSRAELDRYHELQLLEKAGKIRNLKRQIEFELIPKQKGERAVKYKADFVYIENDKTIVEDTKGIATRDYIIKRKLFKLKYSDYEFVEIYKGVPTKYSTIMR